MVHLADGSRAAAACSLFSHTRGQALSSARCTLQVIDDLTREGVVATGTRTSSTDTGVVNGTGGSLLLSYPGNGSSSDGTPSTLGDAGAGSPVDAASAPSSASEPPEPGSAPAAPTSDASASSSQGSLLGAPQGSTASPGAASPANDTSGDGGTAGGTDALGASAPDVKDLYIVVSVANPSASSVLPGELVYLK
jgi:hypothetical protein